LKNILLVNATTRNRGDEARLFAVMSQTDGEFIILNNSSFKIENQKNFKPIFDKIGKKDILKAMLGFKNKIYWYFKNCDEVFDCSGYSLTSEHPIGTTVDSLLFILIARRFGKPITLKAQTFSPFDYKFPFNIIFKIIVPFIVAGNVKLEVRNYPSEENKLFFEKYFKKKIEFKRDVVLEVEQYSLDRIFTEKGLSEIQLIEIPKNTTIIVPNNKTFTKYPTLQTILQNKINVLKGNGENVIILYTDLFDKSILVGGEHLTGLNCVEIEYVIKQAKKVIGLRYHSLIFAHKYKIPFETFGWTKKYDDFEKQVIEEML